MIRQFVHGVCMALADSVPGVSWGTIAFILGFYDRFIGSINDLVYEKGQKRKAAFFYLMQLGIGWVFGMVTAVLVLSSAFESHIYFVSSLFMGFILASLPVVFMQEKDSYLGHWKNIIFALAGAAIVCGITLGNQMSFLKDVHLDALNLPLAIYIFVAGMIAISAMFLPGISGSTLLLIFGLYMPVISGIKEFLHFHLAVFPALCIFGLMIGSLYAITQGPTTLDTPVEALSLSNFHIPAFLAGIVIVAVLQFAGSKKEVK